MLISLFWSIILFFLLMLPFVDKLMTIGAMLFFLSLVSSGLVGILFGSWFSLILFLIFVTGLLVLFGYMMAMSSNLYQISFNSVKNFFLFFFFMLMTLFWVNWNIFEMNFFEKSILVLFSNFNIVFYWVMISVLLIILILVVSLCYKSPSPLRPFMLN